MKRRLYICAILILFSGYTAYSQTCTQILRTARTTYEQGRLHELPSLLEGCLKNGFTQTEKVEAYKILVYTYIYLEEPQKADEAMISLLSTDHFFEMNPAVDPVEFQTLYKKFRTKPLFRIGLKAGLNTTNINVTKNHYIWAVSRGKGKYQSNLNFQAGAVFEKDLSDRFVINPEITYSGSSFLYTNNNLSSVDNSQSTTESGKTISDGAEFTIAQTRLQLNVLVQYRINPKSKYDPYVALGPSVNYLMNSSFSGDLTVKTSIPVSSIDTKENYNPLTYAVMGVAGIKSKFGAFYFTVDVRYQYGLGNVVKASQRYKLTETNTQLWDNGYIDNDFTLNKAMVNIGVIFPIFSPKKLIK